MTSSDRYKTSAGDVLPKSVDWRNEGAMSEIKDQGHCSKCCEFNIQNVSLINYKVKPDLKACVSFG